MSQLSPWNCGWNMPSRPRADSWGPQWCATALLEHRSQGDHCKNLGLLQSKWSAVWDRVSRDAIVYIYILMFWIGSCPVAYGTSVAGTAIRKVLWHRLWSQQFVFWVSLCAPEFVLFCGVFATICQLQLSFIGFEQVLVVAASNIPTQCRRFGSASWAALPFRTAGPALFGNVVIC